MPIIIQASARSDGDTASVAQRLSQEIGAPVVDLLEYTISPYDYSGMYPEEDDFISLVETQLLKHEQWVFASPVYWYSMSGGMKDFFDRLTDLLKTHKPLGRQLRGKRMSVLSCSNDEEVNDSFYDAFRLSADYLGMSYGPEWHGWVEAGEAVFVER